MVTLAGREECPKFRFARGDGVSKRGNGVPLHLWLPEENWEGTGAGGPGRHN